jgi:hypothetical protein
MWCYHTALTQQCICLQEFSLATRKIVYVNMIDNSNCAMVSFLSINSAGSLVLSASPPRQKNYVHLQLWSETAPCFQSVRSAII